MSDVLKSRPIRYGLPALAGAIVVLAAVLLWPRHPGGPSSIPLAKADPLGPRHEERVSFVIRSAGKSRDGRLVFLNNLKDYRAEGAFTVVIDAEEVPEYAGVEPRSLVGKTVEATGVVGEYKGRPQVMVRDAAKLTVK
jgi:hypothetical protein